MTMPVVTHPPAAPALRRQPLAYEAYLTLPDDAGIVEWANGEAFYHMPPTLAHQNITSYLSSLLRFYVNALDLGQVIDPPFEVKLWPEGPSRQPDICFVAQERLAHFESGRFNGGPDLVVETVSPSSATLDRITKFREYERAGVAEYWIIDPRPFQQQADFYARDDAGRFAPAPIGGDGVYWSAAVPGFRLRVAELWRSPLPNPQRALAEMLADAPGLAEELRAAYRELLRLLE